MKKLLFIVLVPVMFWCCKKSSTTANLSVARQMEGKWTTPNPVTFYYSSDGCGGYARYSSFKMKMNWQITAVVTGSQFSMDQNQMLQGVFNFTTDNITGTMNEKDCQIYCGGYSTDANTFILTRVN